MQSESGSIVLPSDYITVDCNCACGKKKNTALSVKVLPVGRDDFLLVISLMEQGENSIKRGIIFSRY